jgi:hypothetical protein
VTIPLWDWILGTLAPREMRERIMAEELARTAPSADDDLVWT